MTEDQLMNELIERGKDASGSREEMLARLLELDRSKYVYGLWLMNVKLLRPRVIQMYFLKEIYYNIS